MTTAVDQKLLGFPLNESQYVPEGFVLGAGGAFYARFLTCWSLVHEGRYPLHSRYSRGMIELERDRRCRG